MCAFLAHYMPYFPFITAQVHQVLLLNIDCEVQAKAYNKLPSVCGSYPWIDNITPLLSTTCGL